jgi:hypothetical protein
MRASSLWKIAGSEYHRVGSRNPASIVSCSAPESPGRFKSGMVAALCVAGMSVPRQASGRRAARPYETTTIILELKY